METAKLRVDSDEPTPPNFWKYDKNEQPTPSSASSPMLTLLFPHVLSLSLYNASAPHHPLHTNPSFNCNLAMASAQLPPPPRGTAVYPHQLYLQPQPAQQQQAFVQRELIFACGALKWGILVFLAVSSFVILMWMIFHPTFPLLNVASAAMAPIAINGTSISAGCNISLLLTNTNRHLNVVYDRMEISLFYPSQQVLLSRFHHPQFVQSEHTRFTFATNLSFSGVDLGSGGVSAMKQDLDGGSLGLVMKVSAVINLRNGKWKTKSHFMRAYCDGVSFAFTSSNRPGIFLNPYQACDVFVYSK